MIDLVKKINMIVDLIAHKKPALKILEMNLETTDASCLWFEAGDASSRAAYLEYSFTSTDAKSLISAQMKHETRKNSSFLMMNPTKEAFGLPQAVSDLIIVKFAEKMEMSMDVFIKNLQPLLLDESYTLFIERSEKAPGMESKGGNHTPGRPDTPAKSTTLLSKTPASSNSETSTPETLKEVKLDIFSTPEASKTHFLENDVIAALGRQSWNPKRLHNLMVAQGFGATLEIVAGNEITAYLYTPRTEELEVGHRGDLYIA